MRILLVEDTESHALLARKALELNDPQVEILHVPDAEQGLHLLERESFDMVLLDYYLPGVTGLSLLRQIRDLGLELPVIMITSQGQVKVAVECLKSGATDYVAKDEGYVDLLPQTVTQAWRQWKAEQENLELHRQIVRKNKELEDSNRRLIEYQHKIIEAQKMSAIMTLVRGICHELNNPLTGILGYAQLLQETYTGEGLEDLHEIETCAQRCREIIAKLAKFCRRERAVSGAVDLNEVIEDALAFVEYYANRNRTQVNRQLMPDLPRMQGNPQDLRQALLAVILNGIQAMKTGGTLSVVTAVDTDSVVVTVSDTGEGIPPENVDQIFMPFFTTREQGQGSGMGLALAYAILAEHGGEIRVESQVGQGSRFSLILPIRIPDAAEAPLVEAPAVG